MSRMLEGMGASAGRALGPVRWIDWDIPLVPHRTISPEEVEREVERFGQARARALEHVLQQIGIADLLAGVRRAIVDAGIADHRLEQFRGLGGEGLAHARRLFLSTVLHGHGNRGLWCEHAVGRSSCSRPRGGHYRGYCRGGSTHPRRCTRTGQEQAGKPDGPLTPSTPLPLRPDRRRAAGRGSNNRNQR